MFLSEDLQKAQAFGDFISNKANWNLSTGDAIQLTKHFAWYNSLMKKIEENILELQKVIEAPKAKK